MAKLKARGRVELARMEKEAFPTIAEDSHLEWKRWTRTLMSDNTVLEKYDTQWRPSPTFPKGNKHSYGWKVHGKLKAGLTPEQWIEIYKKNGFREV